MASISSAKAKNIKKKEEASQSTKRKYKADGPNLLPGESLRKDGQYVYRVVKSDYPGPKDGIKPVYGPTLEIMRQKKRALLNQLNNGLPSDTDATLNDAYDTWKRLKRGIQNNTKKNYIAAYENYVRNSWLGKKQLSAIRKSEIMAFYNRIVDSGAMKAKSLHTLHTVLRDIFQLAVDDRLIQSNPCDRAFSALSKEALAEPRMRVLALSLKEQYYFVTHLRTCEERKWRIIFLFLLISGIRGAELCGLQWSDCNFEKREIRIRHNLVYFANVDKKGTLRPTGFEMHLPKTKSGERTIPMFDMLRDLLLEQKQYLEDAGLKCTENIAGYSDFVYLNRFGRPFTVESLDSTLHRIVRRCNTMAIENAEGDEEPVILPFLTCHSLRHSCCTRLLERKGAMSPLAIQAFLGHKDLQTTLNTYLRITEEFKQKEFGMAQEQETWPNLFDEVFKEHTAERTGSPTAGFIRPTPKDALAKEMGLV